MSIYEELDPMPEHRTQFVFKGMREHIAKVNIPNHVYTNKQTDDEIPHGSRDHVIVPDAAEITFNLDIDLAVKTRSIVKKVGIALVNKNVLMLGSKEIDTTNN